MSYFFLSIWRIEQQLPQFCQATVIDIKIAGIGSFYRIKNAPQNIILHRELLKGFYNGCQSYGPFFIERTIDFQQFVVGVFKGDRPGMPIVEKLFL